MSTLLEVSLKNAGLILLDMQNDFYDPEGFFGKEEILPLSPSEREDLCRRAASLAQSMKDAGRPILYVQTILRKDHADMAASHIWHDRLAPFKGSFLVEEAWGAELIEGLNPTGADFGVVKRGPNAFQHTNLDRVLANLGVDTCILAGGGFPGGLPDTVRLGAALGYEIVIATDAIHPAEARYLASLRNRAEQLETEVLLSAVAALKGPEREEGKGQERYALILVDIENDFVHPDGAYHRFGYSDLSDAQRDMVIDNNRRLSQAMRKADFPVIYIQSTRRVDFLDNAGAKTGRRQLAKLKNYPFLREGGWQSEIVEGLTPQNGDFVVVKKGHSAFGTTPLHRILRNLRVDICIVTGGGVTGCVADTVLEGVGLGHRCQVVSDATYAPKSPHLELLAEWAEIRSTNEILDSLQAT